MPSLTIDQPSRQILGLFTNKWAIYCLGILTFQQLLEASATLWLVKLMMTVTQGGNFIPYLVLYLASLALPYIPLCLAYIFKITWRQEAQRSFIHAFVNSNKNNIGEWSNKGIKEEKLSILTAEGPAALQALIDYVWDLWSYVLSVFFNIMALSIVVEPLFAVAYGFSISCVAIVMKLKRRTQRTLTKRALAARIDLTQSLLAAWDNVLLGNAYNFNIWQKKTHDRLDRCLQRNVALERFDQFLAIFVSMITSIPSLFVVVYYIMNHKQDTVLLTSFIVILPILFMILSYTYQTLSLAFRWTMHKSKLLAIYRSIQISRDSAEILEKKIKWDKMHFSQETTVPIESISVDSKHWMLQSCEQLIEKASQAGRYTIRGENGCGKSTALMLVKNALMNKAFFLPTHTQLSFNEETLKFSTGESLKKRLMEILEKVDIEVLLLDEWDANLDSENKEALTQLINEVALKKCVIEVRHR